MVHPAADLLDRYAAFTFIPEEELAPLEEHLLVCHSCHSRVIVREVYHRIKHFFSGCSSLQQ